MNKYLKWVGVSVAIPFVLFIILSLLFYFPPFQRWAVRQATNYASSKTGMEISLRDVRLKFPLDLSLGDFKMIKPNDSIPNQKDTIADAHKLVADVQLLPLFRQKIEINKLVFEDVKFNTTNFVHEARVQGTVGELSLRSHGIDLKHSTLKLNDALISDANVLVELSDTVPPDTSSSKSRWVIDVDQFKIKSSRFSVHMPGDTLRVYAGMNSLDANNGHFDLYNSKYQIKNIAWSGGDLRYDNRFQPHVKGLDANHVSLSDLRLALSDLDYSAPSLNLKVKECAFKEKEGLVVDHFSGNVSMDSLRLKLPSIKLRTPYSTLHASADIDLNAFDEKDPGVFKASIQGAIGSKDLLDVFNVIPSSLQKTWPRSPLRVDGEVHGNLSHLTIDRLKLNLPSKFDFSASGVAENVTDLNSLKAHLGLDAKGKDLRFLSVFLDKDLKRTIAIPLGINVKGNINVDGSKYGANLLASQGGGSVRIKGVFDSKSFAYRGDLSANHLPLQHFLPGMGLRPFTGTLAVKGKGSDLKSNATAISANTDIRTFGIEKYGLNNIKAKLSLKQGVVSARLLSDNALLKGLLTFDGILNSKKISATLSCDVSRANLHELQLVDHPVEASLCAHIDIESNFKNIHKVQGNIAQIIVDDNGKLYRPEDVTLDILTNVDTTHAVVNSGDFALELEARKNYEYLLKNCNRVVAELQHQIKHKFIDEKVLRVNLPLAHISLTTGKENVFVRTLRKFGYSLAEMNMDMDSSPTTGLNGHMELHSLEIDSVLLDTIRFNISSGNETVTYSGQICNNKHNPQYVFNALFSGGIYGRGISIALDVYDEYNKKGIGISAFGEMEENGMKFSFNGYDPVLGYKIFHVNEDNYIFLANDHRISAKLKMSASDGAGVMVYTNDENKDVLQDITFSLHQFELSKLMSVIPYVPRVSGVMNGDFHIMQTQSEFSVSSDLSVGKMVYENCPMGNISSEFVYMPKSDGAHYVNGMLMQEGREVAAITGSYNSKRGGDLDAELQMFRMPLNLLNGFIPDQLIGFKGYADGKLSIKGSMAKPKVDGEVYLDSAYMVSVPYGAEMRFANDPVRIVDSHLLFENFEMFAHNDSPLDIVGYLDFSDVSNMNMNIRMRARNFLLVDSKENIKSEAYGKAYVNFYGRMKGLLSNLQMQGDVEVLGTTDMKYVLKDSPLSNDNEMDELVKFTNFSDAKTMQTVNRPAINGFNMNLAINIDQGARIQCFLNSDHTNYVDLIGGGDLRMLYNPSDNLRLIGRYTFNSGEVKYSLPVIPLKTFNIQDGSYIEFIGDAMNPKLNIKATEEVKTAVGSEDGSSHVVLFNCGVVITKTLKNMGLEFIIDSPDDANIHNELQTMSLEERGKIAVAMLTTGMYLADGNTKNFTMNSALSAFLNNQISSITGNALRTLDLSFGMENSTDATGRTHTDYSFKFAKRFWNNRLRIVVGGKVSSGDDDNDDRNDSFFNNVTFEYRLSQNSNKYIKVFYEKEAYDWLEGNIGKYGAGFMWKRKLQHFGDIFRFKEKRREYVEEPLDSMNFKVNENNK